MNSQLAQLSLDTNDEIFLRLHPQTAERFALGDRAIITTQFGTLEAPVMHDERLRTDVVTISHGSSECNVSDLTSSHQEIDSLTGMVWQSGLDCEIRPTPQ